MYQEVFNQFMKLMKPFMKSHGFTKKDGNFYKRHPQGNIGIINFQRVPHMPGLFYINISIYSRVLAEAFLAEFGKKEVKKYPSEWEGHWRSRIEDLVPKESHHELGSYCIDDRWDYDENTNIELLFQEISHLIAKFAIPAIDQHITDEQLKNLWFPYEDPGSGELQYLATFFLASGEEEKLNIVLNRLGKVVQDGPQYIGLKKKYDTFMRERRWVDDAYVQELERERELYRSKKRKKKQ